MNKDISVYDWTAYCNSQIVLELIICPIILSDTTNYTHRGSVALNMSGAARRIAIEARTVAMAKNQRRKRSMTAAANFQSLVT